jgi:hypothetical protein
MAPAHLRGSGIGCGWPEAKKEKSPPQGELLKLILGI